MRRVLAAMVVLLFAAATVTACGDDSGDGSGAGPGDGGTAETKTIEVTFSGDTVDPSG